mgnify:CR=1 FL=1
MTDIQVEKKDGRHEPFNREKVRSGILKSSGTTDQAESITVQVENWLSGAATDGLVKVGDIRAKVLELLETSNPEAAVKFREYRKAA